MFIILFSMAKTSNSELHFLSLKNPEKSLEKHPSMKTFFNQVKEKEANNIIINNIQSEEEEKLNNINRKTKITISILECENKLNDGKDTFFIEANNISYNNQKLYKKNKNTIKPLNYEFTEKQKKLDAKITKQIYQGKNYSIIEKNFNGLLKK